MGLTFYEKSRKAFKIIQFYLRKPENGSEYSSRGGLEKRK